MMDAETYLKRSILQTMGQITDSLEASAEFLKGVDVEKIPDNTLGTIHEFLSQWHESLHKANQIVVVLRFLAGMEESDDPRSDN